MFESALEIGAVSLSLGAAVGTAVAVSMAFRKVVPASTVHIVQRGKSVKSYSSHSEHGSVYYGWPSWVPVVGTFKTSICEAIFTVRLDNYEAYDEARLPFSIDAAAFFRVVDAEKAAQRTTSPEQLDIQLKSVLQGAVRRILATGTLSQIMESRSELSERFTVEVAEQVKEWGVELTKSIEFMDIKDSSGSKVIHNMMEKERSRIESEARQSVALNEKTAELYEVNAAREVQVEKAKAEEAVGIRIAQRDLQIGIEQQKSKQAIEEASKATTVARMAVQRVQEEAAADIQKAVQVTTASALLEVVRLNAEGLELEGRAKAAAELASLMAPVEAQLKLAEEIGSNEAYQKYLIDVKKVEASKDVGISMATALQSADLKVIAGGGESLLGSTQGLLSKFSTDGGLQLNGLLSALEGTKLGDLLGMKK
jgi:flotillin